LLSFFYLTTKSSLQSAIEKWYADETQHSIIQLSFKQLFDMIMKIIENHPQKDDIKERLKQELTDSIGLCFLGRINRMVNSLMGFVDGIQIGLSVKEEIQMKIELIIKNIMNKKIKKKEAISQMKILFEKVGEEDNITENFKQANLIALEDFDDDDEEEEITTVL
jgi:hypothetical protein